MRRLGIVAVLGCCLAGPALAGKADNSVRFTYPATLDRADVYFSNGRLAIIVADAVWDTLIFRNPKTGVFEPSLATAWRWLDDRTLELKLRHDVRFHNGEAFDADDVVYTLNYVLDPENGALARSRVAWIARAERVDADTVRIVTAEPYPAALATLASPFMAMYPDGYYREVGPAGMNAQPIGSGPYRVVEHAVGKSIRLERDPEYRGPKAGATIDEIVVRAIPDAQTRVAEVVAGGLDLLMNVSRDQAEQLRERDGLQVVAGDSIRYAYLALDTRPTTVVPALLDLRVRRAIAHAIDRETIVQYLVGSSGRVLHAPCHPEQFGCDDTLAPRYAYDPERARALLAEAGYAKGFRIDFFVPNRDRNVVEAIVGYLGAVGIDARLRTVEAVVAAEVLRTGRAALGYNTDGSSSILDIAAGLSRYYAFQGDDITRDPEVRDLIVRGDRSLDSAVRRPAYAQALQLIAERVYGVPLTSVPVYYVGTSDLVFTPFADEIPRFWEMRWR